MSRKSAPKKRKSAPVEEEEEMPIDLNEDDREDPSKSVLPPPHPAACFQTWPVIDRVTGITNVFWIAYTAAGLFPCRKGWRAEMCLPFRLTGPDPALAFQSAKFV